MFTWTEKPYETMWSHLRLLSHATNARSLLCGQLGSQRRLCPAPLSTLEAKARQVAYCIVQAHEYYQAAEAVTIHTSPLLCFYGMLSLAKAVIVANEPDTLLDNIKSHGLGRDRSNTSTKMENQTAATSQGVFAHLSNVVQGFAYPKGAVIRIKDVFSISPELAQMYERYFDEPPRSVYSYGTKALSNNPFRLEVRTAGPDPQRVYRRIPELAVDFDLQPHPGVAGDLAFQSKDHVKESPGYFGLYDAVVAGNFLVGALPFLWNGVPTKRYLSPPLGDYIAMFILSNCVRYKQDLWGEVVQGRETGILGLIDLFLEVSKRRFPNFILDHLFGEHFGYGTPARILGPPR